MDVSRRNLEVAELVVPAAGLADAAALGAKEQRIAIVMTLMFWAVNVSVQILRQHMDGAPNLGAMLIARLTTAALGLALCYGIHFVMMVLYRRPFAARVFVLVVLAVLAALVCCWTNYSLMTAWGTGGVGTQTYADFLQGVIYWSWFFLAWSALYLALQYSYATKQSEQRARFIEREAHAAQLRALQNQINPHFMFNTLNAISGLMLDGQVARAENMITGLSDFLRSTLSLDAVGDVTVAEELKMQRMYLAIEHVRFPDMTVEIDMPRDLDNALIPALITQPLIENAVKYGVAASQGTTRVAISASRSGNRLRLAVENDSNAQRRACAGLGVGLSNVERRLRARYGTDFRFAAGPFGDGGYRVDIEVPLAWAR